ncbi:cyclic nucleotide-binding domain protein (macronuclear) [Tetrahymena thermophila SB210]|uniref:Cyclic nucleotide-binding domain protein n=1 Tax=Tetrahymena thermophila (strain SB210) TaxID=312017 RepID=W7X6R4_TETTS|nr:cyclic nucleotide-binding domain protein [Tetrahymena thermophila SB210]EWS72073.1 cyclic nucleotide-binding domain protein [Tetrahymena thermophila SB210]|eukprot:XP_012655384.1 cyclic nucleotide-binding domain protein [Tetrahymena thermophila SB210]
MAYRGSQNEVNSDLNVSRSFNNKSYLQSSKFDESIISQNDIKQARQIEETFAYNEEEDNFDPKRQQFNFRINNREDLSRVNKRKDTEMQSVDLANSVSNRQLGEIEKSPATKIKNYLFIEESMKQLQIQNSASQKNKKKEGILQSEEDEHILNKGSSNPQLNNKTTQDLTNQPSYNVVLLDGVPYLKQQSSNQRPLEPAKNDLESFQNSNNNLKIGNSFRKNLNSDISLNEKSPINFESQNFDTLNKNMKASNNILVPPQKINESFLGSACQDTFRPGNSQQICNTHTISKSKAVLMQDHSKPGNKKDLNALLQNSRKIKLISKIKQKFCAYLQNHTLQGRTKILDSNIRNMISDDCDYGYNRYKKKKQIHSLFIVVLEFIIEKLIYLTRLEKLPLFDPENPVKIIFNSIIVAYNCFFLYWMSIEVFFEAHVGDINEILGYTAQACWITEMLLQMNTCLYHDNEYITDRKEIMVIYVQEYLFFEILPLIFEGRKSDNIAVDILLHLPLLLKLKGMTIILEKLEFYVLQILKNHYFLQLFKLIMLLFIIAHFEACLYNVLGEIEIHFMHKEKNWIDMNPIRDGHWWNSYLTSLFWAFSVMMNTSTSPTTDVEIIFTCLCMLFSCVFFGYTLNMIGNILMDIQRQQKEYKKDLNILNQFMKRKDASLSYRRKANISLQDFYAHNREKIQAEKEILAKLNPNLVKEILIAANKNVISNYTLFTEQFTEEILDKIYINLEEETYAPRQVIISSHNVNEEEQCIYFIVNGKVQIFEVMDKKEIQTVSKIMNKTKEIEKYATKHRITTQKSMGELHHNERMFKETKDNYEIKTKKFKKIINILTKGQAFGEYGFFTGMGNDYMAQSQNFTTVMKIKRSKFLEILQGHPQEYERYCEIRDKILNEREDNMFYCYLCDGNDHKTMECNKVFFDKYYSNFFFQQNYSRPQLRAKDWIRNGQLMNRKRQRYHNTLVKMKNLQNCIDKIQEDDHLRDILEKYYEEIEQLHQSDSDLEEDDEDDEYGELNHTDSLSLDKTFNSFDNRNEENQSQMTIKSTKSGAKRKSILNNNNLRDDSMNEDKVESLVYKQIPVNTQNYNNNNAQIYLNNEITSININQINNNLTYNDVQDSPITKKRHLSALYAEDKNFLDQDSKNQMGEFYQNNNLPSRSMLNNNNNIRKLSAAKKSTFLSESLSYNTKEFEDHFNRTQDMLNQQNSSVNDQQKEIYEILNATNSKLKYITDKYRNLFNHYVNAKRQLKTMRVDSPRNKTVNQQKYNHLQTMAFDLNESQMMVESQEKNQQQPQSQFTPQQQAMKSKFQEEASSNAFPLSQQNAINKESLRDIDKVTQRYPPHKETIIMNAASLQQNFIWTFDKSKNYFKYFPESNLEKMIRKTNIQIQKNLKKKNIRKKETTNHQKIKQFNSIKSDGKQNSSLLNSKQAKIDESKKSKNDQNHQSIFQTQKQKDRNMRVKDTSK